MKFDPRWFTDREAGAEAISKKLKTEDDETARVLSRVLTTLHEDDRVAFALWWDEGVFPGVERHGWTVERFINDRGFDVINAFSLMSGFLKDPETLLEALSYEIKSTTVLD